MRLDQERNKAIPAAIMEMARAIHPRNSFPAFWRRLISMSIRRASPVRSLNPDKCHAKSSLDIARSSLDVLWGFEDIESFIGDVKGRYQSQGPWNKWGNYPHDELSQLGHLAGVDLPRLIALVEKLVVERK